MSTVFTGTYFHTLKKTLRKVIVDKTDGLEADSVMRQFCKEGTTDENYFDDLETAGPGLASEKTEGAPIAAGTMREGTLTRYLVRTFGLKVIITRELMEDCKYDKAIQAVKRLKRAMVKTYDIDATNVLVRAFNSSYVGGDGLSLANSSHILPNGGTYSNQMATAMSPSRAAMIVAASSIKKLPGHDGITEGYMPKKVVCPTEQWAVWEPIVYSEKAPEPGEFNAPNVVRTSLKIEGIVANQYWSNTTTNWMVTTDAEDGEINFVWRRKPSNDDWIDNDGQTYKFAITARWTRGWSDARGTYWSNA